MMAKPPKTKKNAPPKKSPSKPAAKPAKSSAKKAAPAARPAKAPKNGAARARDLLMEEQARLRKRLGHIMDDDASADTSNVGDIADVATHHENRELLREIQLTEEDQLQQVDAALLRIEKGTYGLCERCSNPIEPARLEALPHAPTCISCKRREERGEFAKK